VFDIHEAVNSVYNCQELLMSARDELARLTCLFFLPSISIFTIITYAKSSKDRKKRSNFVEMAHEKILSFYSR